MRYCVCVCLYLPLTLSDTLSHFFSHVLSPFWHSLISSAFFLLYTTIHLFLFLSLLSPLLPSSLHLTSTARLSFLTSLLLSLQFASFLHSSSRLPSSPHHSSFPHPTSPHLSPPPDALCLLATCLTQQSYSDSSTIGPIDATQAIDRKAHEKFLEGKYVRSVCSAV